MATQYLCKQHGRRDAVLAAKKLNGIDYVEIASADQTTIQVFFLFPQQGVSTPQIPSPSVLTKDNLVIQGGVRIQNIQITSISAADNVLTIKVSDAGDFSNYTLRIVSSPTQTDQTPTGFDPPLSAIDFSFKVACPSEFDCQTSSPCPSPSFAAPELNYLAKDYQSFRRLMLDRMSITMPQWTERNPADMQVAIVETLAYVADHLSYYQDAVATEAYLGTARQRISVRRHARLLNYRLHEGCNARAFVHLDIHKGSPTEAQTLPAKSRILMRGSSQSASVRSSDLVQALRESPVVFESLHDVTLFSAHNELAFYTWNESECCLPAGATQATLRPKAGNDAPQLKAGDLLLFEEIAGAVSGLAVDADPAHRHVVCLKTVSVGKIDPLDGQPVYEIEWFDEDALPFPLCLSSASATGQALEISVARGNIVLADHGLEVGPESLIPASAPVDGLYRPVLQQPGVTFAVPFDAQVASTRAAALSLVQDPREALASVTLGDSTQTWTARSDLLSSDRFAPDFVVETEGGVAHLRFGDDVLGAAPEPETTFQAAYRIGSGSAGNLGAGALARVVWDTVGIDAVRNPIPATGGTDPESLDQARQFAPVAFRVQQRAVTADDYVQIAERHPEVLKAAARFRWTGSWYTVFVTIERTGGRVVDPPFKQDILSFIDHYRMAGYDLEVSGPTYVPLNILLQVCVKAGYIQADVRLRLFQAFSNRQDSLGRQGFFYPDRFTFGQPVFLSQVYQRAMEVDGVASVDALLFQRWGRNAGSEIDDGFIRMEPLEVARLANDANFPENGKIDFLMGGGL